MKFKEFLEYLEQNLEGYGVYMKKALSFQCEKNSRRPVGKRWSDERLNKEAYSMWRMSMEMLYNNLRSAVTSDSTFGWIDYIKKNDIFESVNDVISELDFFDEVA